MQITKSTEQKEERAIVPFKEQVKEFPKKVGNFFSGGRKKTLIVTASVLVIAAAIGINWMLFGPSSSAVGTNKPDENATEPADNATQTKASNEDEVDAGYFALAVLDRQKARDEALEVLQVVVENTDAASDERNAAAASISRIASYIEEENNIETLVKSKGFSQCVAVVSEESVSVIVGTPSTLMANELAQIKEIIYLQTGVDPSGMRITEKILPADTEPTQTALNEDGTEAVVTPEN